MMLEEIISKLKDSFNEYSSLELACYYFIKKEKKEIIDLDFSTISGEVEEIAFNGFNQQYVDQFLLKETIEKIKKNLYKGLSVYHYLGIYAQDILSDSKLFKFFLLQYFNIHSLKYKFIIAKSFKEFEDKLIHELRTYSFPPDHYYNLLCHFYFEKSINKVETLKSFINNVDNLDIIDLVLLEDLLNIKSINYNKVQEQLFNDIFWCATEIQSKHKLLNNNEDQYNSNFQSLLKAKGYKTEPQTQRGISESGIQYGELDIAIFTKDNMPLSIFEAFNVISVTSESGKEYIEKHLKKLSENYDPNGHKKNYAIAYIKHKNFSEFWNEYSKFVITIPFENKLVSNEFHDITARFEPYAGIKIGLTKHLNKGSIVEIIHVFMNMNL